jgi:hypothetical protein
VPVTEGTSLKALVAIQVLVVALAMLREVLVVIVQLEARLELRQDRVILPLEAPEVQALLVLHHHHHEVVLAEENQILVVAGGKLLP